VNLTGWISLVAGARERLNQSVTANEADRPGIAGSIAIQRLGLNSLWLFLTRIGSQLLLMVFSVIVARQLGASGFGQLALILSVLTIANVFCTFGIDTLLIRDIARNRAMPVNFLGESVWLQLGISAVAIATIYILTGRSAQFQPGLAPLVVIYSLALIPLAFYSVFSAALRGYERMDLFLLVNLVIAAFQVLGAVILVTLNGDLEFLIGLMLAVQLIGTVLAGMLCHTRLPGFHLGWQIDFSRMEKLLHAAWPFALLTGIGVVFQRIGILLVAHFLDYSSVGWFSAASRVVEAGKVIHFALLGALLPFLSRSATAESLFIRDSLNRISLYGLLAASFSIALVVSALASPIIQGLYGAGYQPAVEALRILVWGLVPFSFAAWASVNLVTGGQEWRSLQVSAMALLATIMLGIGLIQREGLNGACLAILCGETILAGLYIVYLRGRTGEDAC